MLSNRSIFIRFLFSYLIVLLFALIIGGITYTTALNIVESDSREANLAMLEKSRNIIEQRLEEVHGLIMQLSLDSDINRSLMLTGPFNHGPDIYILKELQNDFTSYLLRNTFIFSLQLYLNKSKVIVTSDNLYIREDIYYSDFFQFGSPNSSLWRNRILTSPHTREYLPVTEIFIHKDESTSGIRKRFLPIVQSLPMDSYTNPMGMIAAFIDIDELRKLLSSSLITAHGWAVILDEKDSIICSYGISEEAFSSIDFSIQEGGGSFDKEINDEKMSIIYTSSDYNGWKYVAALPHEIAMIKVSRLSHTILLLLLTLFGVGILSAVMLAYHNSKPLKEIFSVIKEISIEKEVNTSDNFESIGKKVSEMAYRNKIFQERLKSQQHLLHQAFLGHLLHGHFQDTGEISIYSSQTGLLRKNQKMVLFLIESEKTFPSTSIKEIEELSAIKLLLQELIRREIDNDIIFHHINLRRLAVFYPLQRPSASEATQNLAVLIENAFPLRFSTSASNEVNSPADVRRAYIEASAALEYKQAKVGFTWYEDIPKTGKSRYSLSQEQKLFNRIAGGDFPGASEILKEIERENFTDRKITIEAQRQLISDVRSTMIKLSAQLERKGLTVHEKLKTEIRQFDYPATYPRMFELITEIFREMCTLINSIKKSHNIELRDNIIAYIEQHYSDPELYLASLADYFSITYVYLSQFFKEQTGVNFSVYLERIRIRHATELMDTTDLTIEQIASRTGYHSCRVFREAFKRVKGILPRAYLKNRKS